MTNNQFCVCSSHKMFGVDFFFVHWINSLTLHCFWICFLTSFRFRSFSIRNPSNSRMHNNMTWSISWFCFCFFFSFLTTSFHYDHIYIEMDSYSPKFIYFHLQSFVSVHLFICSEQTITVVVFPTLVFKSMHIEFSI